MREARGAGGMRWSVGLDVQTQVAAMRLDGRHAVVGKDLLKKVLTPSRPI
jgi:hypothetical protein